MYRRGALLLSTLLAILSIPVAGQVTPTDGGPAGTVRGSIVDRETLRPVTNVLVVVEGLGREALSDAEGQYVLGSLPVGSYSVRLERMGYAPALRANVVVKSDRITFVNLELEPAAVGLEGLVVNSGYFPPPAEPTTSSASFQAEELRRAPGSAGDVSRVVMTLPSIAKVNDLSNGLIVRGGSPMENLFLVDNIEVPNINHFPSQGSSAGPIGLLNVELIDGVDFHSGGFSAAYGDRLSSVMDITLREGNRIESDVQLDLSFAGIGGVAEGPIGNRRGSWIMSARRSFLDLLVDAIGTGTEIVPQYSDYQGKLVYDLTDGHRVSAIAIVGDDEILFGAEAAIDNDQFVYGGQEISEGTYGLNWRALWSDRFSSETSLSLTRSRFVEGLNEVVTDADLIEKRSLEQDFVLRNENYVTLGPQLGLRVGVDARRVTAEYDNRFDEYTDGLGAPTPALVMSEDITENKVGAFASLSVRAIPRITATIGLRTDYFSYNDNAHVSPRLALSYELDARTRLNASGGIFRQTLPLILLAQHEENRELDDPRAVHYVVGIERLLTDDTRLTLEAYQKDYSSFPLDPVQPGLFLVDELYYRYGFFFNHGVLSDSGEARSKGVELMVQKKLASGLYGLASASYFRTRYRSDDGTWTDRVYDNRWLASIEGGYKPNSSWEFSARWIYAGGAPYTPLDLQATAQLDRDVLDANRINAERYPAYHSLNVRFDRRFHFQGSNLTWYVSVWNAYGRNNVSSYYWNPVGDRVETVAGWGMLPIFGIEYEF
jgi:hypothetical protein